MTTIADLMARHDIAASVTRHEGCQRDDHGWEYNAYRFTLSVAGEPILMNAPYRAGLALEEPTPADLFSAIMLDIASVDGREDWLDWADDLALLGSAADARKARNDHHEISARRSLLAERLGEDAVAELIAAANEL